MAGPPPKDYRHSRGSLTQHSLTEIKLAPNGIAVKARGAMSGASAARQRSGVRPSAVFHKIRLRPRSYDRALSPQAG